MSVTLRESEDCENCFNSGAILGHFKTGIRDMDCPKCDGKGVIYPDRPTKHEYWMDIADGVKKRATCGRRQVGAVIVDADGLLLSSGYNGPPKRLDHCIDVPCKGAKDLSGNTENCIAIHAEQNALLQAGDRLKRAYSIYTTTLPCFTCAKLIIQAGITKVFFREGYPDNRSAQLFWEAGVALHQISHNPTPVE